MPKNLAKATLIAALVPLGAAAALAQFGSIFGDPAPRPPGSVPGGRQSMPTPMPAPQSQPPNTGALPPVDRQRPADLQSQPLPPPPGATANAPGALPGLPQGQRQPRGQVEAALPPSDDVVAEPPANKIVNTAALFSGLDKITGRIINFDVRIGETVQFGALQVTTRACYTRPPTEAANTDAFVEVDEVTLQGQIKRIFTGWIFAASPGLHAVEHPIYDIWLTDCRGAVVAEKPEPPPAPAPARVQQRPPQPQQKRAAPPPAPAPLQGFPPFR